jgi:hypothetical protein
MVARTLSSNSVLATRVLDSSARTRSCTYHCPDYGVFRNDLPHVVHNLPKGSAAQIPGIFLNAASPRLSKSALGAENST